MPHFLLSKSSHRPHISTSLHGQGGGRQPTKNSLNNNVKKEDTSTLSSGWRPLPHCEEFDFIIRRECSCIGENGLNNKFVYFICPYLSGVSIPMERNIFPGLSYVLKHVKRFRITRPVRKVLRKPRLRDRRLSLVPLCWACTSILKAAPEGIAVGLMSILQGNRCSSKEGRVYDLDSSITVQLCVRYEHECPCGGQQ